MRFETIAPADRSFARWALALALLLAAAQNPLAMEPDGAMLDALSDHRFPVTPAVIDVTQPPYSAKGDDKTDDTAALQRALNDLMGRHKILFLPNGTYLISSTLNWGNKQSDGRTAYGFNWIQGQNPLKTIVRLKDKTFTDRAKPTAMMWCGGFGSADWFHNYVQDVTFDTGRGNAGAIGLQFYSNNSGALRNVAISSGDRAGLIGLDLAHRDMNGPLLVENVAVRGFEVGIRTGAAVNSQTFEGISLSGQSKYGFVNTGQSIAIRRLHSENAVPALRLESPTSVLEATLIGTAGAGARPAVESATTAFHLRDLSTTGYKTAVANGKQEPLASAEKVTELLGGKPTSPFGGHGASLRLTVRETPDVPWDDPAGWAIVDAFGADPSAAKDSSAAIQKAIDSGATTIFFPGFYQIEKPVIVRGKARRLLGTGAWIDYNGKSKPDFIISDGDAPVVSLEHFAPINGGIAIRTNRTVVLSSLETRRIATEGKGDLFLEDIATDDFKVAAGQHVWARQLNIENQGTHLTNDGGTLWVLGYKTERGGTLLHTRNGGQSEIFGTFSYTTTAGKLAPMFMTEDAEVFAFFNEICFSGDPFAMLIRESRKGVVREVRRGEGNSMPYVGR